MQRNLVLGLIVLVGMGGSAWALTWTTQNVDAGGWQTSLALNGSGLPRIGYYSSTGLRYAAWDGSNWSPQTVDSNGSYDLSLALAPTTYYPRIGYTNSSNALRYAAWGGSTWTYQTVDDNKGGSGNSIIVSLKLDSTGNPRIAYQDSSTNPNTLNYASSNGSAWTIQTVDNYATNLSLALASNGNPHISYFSLVSGLKYATSDGSSWTIETVTNSVQYTSIAVDASGNPRISYYEPNNKDLWYAYRDGSGWHTQKVDETGDMGAYCSLALDTSGNPRISYLDGANFRLKYASYDGASWTFETADSTSGAGYYTSLAMDSSGNAHISYSTSSNWLKYANGAVPEASTWLLFGVGLAVLAAWRRRRR